MELKSTEKPHAAVVGGAWIELAIDVPKFPDPGETIYTDGVTGRPGGRAPSIAMGLASLGCRVFLLSCVGMDASGSQVLNGVKQAGVNVDFAERAESSPTGIIHALRDPGGNSARLVSRSAGPAMTRTPLLSAKAMISSCQLMALMPDIPEDIFLFALDVAHHFQVPVLALAAPAEKLPAGSIPKIDLLIVDKPAAKILTGVYPDTIAKVDEALNHLLRKGAGAAVAYLNGGGAAATAAVRSTKYFPPAKSGAPSATEALDAFAAGIAYGLMIGAPLQDAVTFALANADATASRSDRDRFPSAGEILEKLAVQ